MTSPVDVFEEQILDITVTFNRVFTHIVGIRFRTKTFSILEQVASDTVGD